MESPNQQKLNKDSSKNNIFSKNAYNIKTPQSEINSNILFVEDLENDDKLMQQFQEINSNINTPLASERVSIIKQKSNHQLSQFQQRRKIPSKFDFKQELEDNKDDQNKGNELKVINQDSEEAEIKNLDKKFKKQKLIQEISSSDEQSGLVKNENENNSQEIVVSKKDYLIKKVKEIKIIISTIVKIVFHYLDCSTDWIITYQYGQLSYEMRDHFVTMLFMGLCCYILFLCLLADRGFSFIYLKQQQIQENIISSSQLNKNKKINSIVPQERKSLSKRKLTMNKFQRRQSRLSSNQFDFTEENKNQLPILEQIKLFVISFSYSDYVYILIKQRTNVTNLQEQINQKALIELICENYMFLFASLTFFLIKYIKGETLVFLDFSSVATSLFSTVFVIFKNFGIRYKEQHIFKFKYSIKFQDMNPITQRYVSNPYPLSYYKYISTEKFKYREIIHSQKQQEIKKQLVKKLSNVKKFVIFLVILFQIMSMTIPFAIQNCLENAFLIYVRFCQGFIAYLPQCYVYLQTFKKQQQEKYLKELENNKVEITQKMRNVTYKKELCKLIAASPYIFILGSLELRFPLGVQVFPFVQELKENWCLNVIPTWYGVTFRLLVQFYDIGSLFYIISRKVQHSQMEALYSQQDINDRIHNQSQDNLIWILLIISSVCQAIVFIFYVGDFIWRKYIYKEAKKDKFIQELYEVMLKKVKKEQEVKVIN